MTVRSFTLKDVIDRNARLHGSRTAFVFDRERVSHAQYAARAARLAAGLGAAGVGMGDRIGILAPNGLEYVDLFGAAATLGAIVVPINWRLSAQEVAHVIEDATPQLLIVSSEFQVLVPQAASARIPCYTTGPGPATGKQMQALYIDAETAPAPVTDDTGLVILYTAAIDGRPRGALLSHGNLIAASTQAQLAWRLTPADVNLGFLPLFHIAGIGLLLAAQHAGGATLLLSRFDPPSVVRHIADDGGSLIGTFAPMLGALTDAAEGRASALANLRIVSGIDSPDTIGRFHATCPGARFWSLYGQTETTGQVCMAPFDERPGSAGRPTVLNTVAVVDECDCPLGADGTGEIAVRGPMVFHGYWRRDADNATTLRNGWHHTGDLGRIDDDGYLWYGGRMPAKELIKPGGENVYPGEVERAILEHPALARVAVIGVPDPQWGEAVKAICVLKSGHSLNAEELIEFVGTRIARYKKPKQVVFVQVLPLTPAGLVDRDAVKAEHGLTVQTS